MFASLSCDQQKLDRHCHWNTGCWWSVVHQTLISWNYWITSRTKLVEEEPRRWMIDHRIAFPRRCLFLSSSSSCFHNCPESVLLRLVYRWLGGGVWGGGGEQTLAIKAYSGFHISQNWPVKYQCKQACFPFIKCIFFVFLSSFSVTVRKRRHAATTRTMSASPAAPLLRGWGLYVNVAATKSSGDMNSTQMCTYPCGKVRRKRPVRFVEAHSLQCTHMSKHTASGLDPSHIGEGTRWELPITQTSRKSRSQTVQWLVAVGDTARRGGWEERKNALSIKWAINW